MLLLYLSAIDSPEDKRKFELLYTKYKRLMYQVAYNILHDSFTAEDAVHDSFIILSKCLNNINDIECPRTKNYLVIIVRNVSINSYNKRKRHLNISFESLEPILERSCYISTEDIENNEAYEKLVNAILALPGKYADALFLKYDNKLTNAEIAKTLDISTDNVKKTMQRAKAALAKKIYEDGDSNDIKYTI